MGSHPQGKADIFSIMSSGEMEVGKRGGILLYLKRTVIK